MRINRRQARLGLAASILLVASAAMATPGTGPATAAPPRGVDTEFSIAVIPDTQTEVLSATDSRLADRMNWLITNRRQLDLRYVTHVGDVVNWGWLDASQYAIADSAFRLLDRAKIPYALAVGNHDTRAADIGGGAYADNPECLQRFSADECHAIPLLRHTEEFNATFPPSRIRGLQGTFEPGKVDNNFTTFSAGGVDWLVLTLEAWPRFEAVTWAQGVVAAHPRHNVVIQTHHYLNDDGSIYTFDSTAALTSPQFVYDHLVKVYPNIRFVLSGHTGNFATRVDTGTSGNRIVSLLTAIHSETTNPLRLMTIDTAKDSLRTWLYAPRTNVTTTTDTFTGLDFIDPS